MPPSQLTPPSGSSSISGIAVLENPQQQKDSPKTLFFDAHLFCPVDGLENNSDIENEGDQDKKTRKVIKVLDSATKDLPNIASPELSNEDYSLVGDIVSLIPAQIEHACNRFVVHASGYLTTAHSDTQTRMLTFDLAPGQYTYAYKDYNKNLTSSSWSSSITTLPRLIRKTSPAEY